ncbi:MAG: hypothetical protein BroJett021_52450 [Chloroflexota bacterium]|nr:MAG: hypothetical protein BroJett021_52450 [Chloroflexota bacterium]
MGTKVILEWDFTPPTFFEEEWSFSFETCDVRVSAGKIEATLDSAEHDADPAIRARLDAELQGRFLGGQLSNLQPYKLSRGATIRLHPDGRRDVSVLLESGVFAVASIGSVDFRRTDSAGNVIEDTKRARIDERKALAARIASARLADHALDSAVQSYEASLREPEVSLVRLYEIKDAICNALGGTKAACAALGLGEGCWDRLHELCNNMPLKQGRHLGSKKIDDRRDATEDELREARGIARMMIEKYLNYIDASAHAVR